MKSAIFITSGIGNAVYLIPLIKTLKLKGEVHAFTCSAFHSEDLFAGYEPILDAIIDIRNNSSLLRWSLQKFLSFDSVYIDRFGATRRNLMFASLISKSVVVNHIPPGLPEWARRKIRFVAPGHHLHEATQYLRFANREEDDALLNEERMKLQPLTSSRSLPASYITIQPGAGNNLTPWKIWPLESWRSLIGSILEAQDDIQILILGDKHDVSGAHSLAANSRRVTSLADQTDLAEIPALLANSKLHIGGDSGLLHVAGSVGTPTLTIVGGSDPELFGWQKINPTKHRIVQHKLSCHPCYRWYLPNRSRVDRPELCPDFKCIRSITAEEVMEVVNDQMSAPHVS